MTTQRLTWRSEGGGGGGGGGGRAGGRRSCGVNNTALAYSSSFQSGHGKQQTQLHPYTHSLILSSVEALALWGVIDTG